MTIITNNGSIESISLYCLAEMKGLPICHECAGEYDHRFNHNVAHLVHESPEALIMCLLKGHNPWVPTNGEGWVDYRDAEARGVKANKPLWGKLE